MTRKIMFVTVLLGGLALASGACGSEGGENPCAENPCAENPCGDNPCGGDEE